MTEMPIHNKALNERKLLDFGFVKQEDQYHYLCDIVEGQMHMSVAIAKGGEISTRVIDKSTEEEYVLHRVPAAAGVFVGKVKAEYEVVLQEISEKCFDPDVFKSEQAKAVIAYVRDTYQDELEFLWQRFSDNAVVRRKDNQKWYAAILTVSRRKLGFDADERVEIIDLRMKPEDIEKTVDNIKYLPGYHMNKKHWITICLDGRVTLDEIFERIDNSYQLAVKG